jgi:hypothetical protein
MTKAEQHYHLDPAFQALVDMLTEQFLVHSFVAADVKQAVDLAQKLAWAQQFARLESP